ncbi:MAG: hypothetical protein RLZZ459_182 [Cyanobacteriota bacterium]
MTERCSVFFCDQERCRIQPVRARDPDHAIAQRFEQRPPTSNCIAAHLKSDQCRKRNDPGTAVLSEHGISHDSTAESADQRARAGSSSGDEGSWV